ncbi:expressed unknown protein [Seminavis robusta]|uniref:Uncharacterized protein n=1 Tax=Seminavis robusta TaxID=568900 RepID=A0A9N8HF13_9STRA|nr:expressed unknown protein [Seminavis robusta]|eukprot:Sro410_g137480.1 n/a (340) ;mRNA; f:58281-59300
MKGYQVQANLEQRMSWSTRLWWFVGVLSFCLYYDGIRSFLREYSSVIRGRELQPQQQQRSNTAKDHLVLENDESDPATNDDLKLALYMTTHWSDEHEAFLRSCWPAAVQRFPQLQQADLIVYDTSSTRTGVHDKEHYHLLQSLGFHNVRVYHAQDYEHAWTNSTANSADGSTVDSEQIKQQGAITAMLAPFPFAPPVTTTTTNDTASWFDDYDWVIRLNPDVLFRNVDDWILPTLHNTTVDAIVIKYYPGALHTDFYAFRPHAIDGHALWLKYHKQAKRKHFHAETHIHPGFAKVLQRRRAAWLPNVTLTDGSARVGGPHCPVVHAHSILSHCPNYFDY